MLTEPQIAANKTPRERRREKRLQLIKDTALELVVEGGIAAFSMHKLAARIDLTTGALYRYFASVDHLLMAVQIDVLEGFDRYMVTVTESHTDAPPLVQIATICQAYMALDDLQPQRFRLISRFVSLPDAMITDEDAARSAMGPTMRLLGHLATAIERAQQSGALTPGNALERAVIGWSSVQGLIDRRKLGRLNPEVFNAARLANTLLHTFLVGWGASGAQADEALAATPSADFFRNALEHS